VIRAPLHRFGRATFALSNAPLIGFGVGSVGAQQTQHRLPGHIHFGHEIQVQPGVVLCADQLLCRPLEHAHRVRLIRINPRIDVLNVSGVGSAFLQRSQHADVGLTALLFNEHARHIALREGAHDALLSSPSSRNDISFLTD